MPCNSCGGRSAPPPGVPVPDEELTALAAMTPENSEEVIWIDPNLRGMMHYWASVSRQVYRVWKIGQKVRIYRIDREEFERLGYIATAGT